MENHTTTLQFVQEHQYAPEKTPIPIAKTQRPTYRIKHWGTEYLSDVELLCVLLPNTDWQQTRQTAQRILTRFGHRFSNIAKASIYDLCQIKGVTPTAAQKIYAAFAIAQRRNVETALEKTTIKSSKDVHHLMVSILRDLAHEEFWVLMLNRANKVINRVKISQGGISGTVVDGKIIFRKALENKCSSIILCHNHPSGNLRPSQADIDVTKKLHAAGKVLDVSVLDHIIVGADMGYYSFADEGML